MTSVSHKWISFGLLTLCILTSAGLSLLWTSNVYAVLPPRPTVSEPASDDNAGNTITLTSLVNQIYLRVTPTYPTYWTVVQWQDSQGVWRDVEGWRGEAAHGEISWWVAEKDFGKGPFRWAIYPQGGPFIERVEGSVIYRKAQPMLAVSQPFFLPTGASSSLGVFLTVTADKE